MLVDARLEGAGLRGNELLQLPNKLLSLQDIQHDLEYGRYRTGEAHDSLNRKTPS